MFAMEVLQVVEELRLMSVMAETRRTTVGDGRGAATGFKMHASKTSFSRLDPSKTTRVM